MKSRILVMLVCLSLPLFGCGNGLPSLDEASAKPVDHALVSNNPALVMVERFNIGSNLELMANQASKLTHTYAMVAEKHGAINAPAVVAEEIKKLTPLYQEQWNQNLANSYALHLSQEELYSIALDGKKSQYFGKFKDVQNVVGIDMQKASTPVLTDLVSKALLGAIK